MNKLLFISTTFHKKHMTNTRGNLLQSQKAKEYMLSNYCFEDKT